MKKKIITILFALSLVFALCLVVCADDYTEWTVSDDGNTLIVEDTSYELYTGYLSKSDTFSPEVTYIYANKYSYYQLERNNENLDIFCFTGDIYVSRDGKKSLDEFINGKFGGYKIVYGSSYMSTTQAWVDGLDGGTIVSFDVRDLQSVTRYYVFGYDKTDTMAHTFGAIYSVNGSYYFINYDKLPNNYFDANGEFSYRGGEVNAYKLNTIQESDMDFFGSSKTSFKYEYEKNNTQKEVGEGFYMATFVIVTAIFGYVIPLIPTVIGAIKITKFKTPNPKRWFVVLGLCALWIVVATLTLFAMIF